MGKIEIKNLSYSYTASSKAVDDLSLQIEQGSFTAIIGHNGSGKSTLAKLIVGLLRANSGQIFIDGVLLEEKSINDIRKKIAIVFQNPDNQFIGSTVEDDIAFGLENRQVPSEEMPGIINRYAGYVKMTDYLKKEPTSFWWSKTKSRDCRSFSFKTRNSYS